MIQTKVVMRMAKLKVIVVSHPQSGSCVLFQFPLPTMIEECETLLEEGSDGDSITFKIEYMTKKEYLELEEWTGW